MASQLIKLASLQQVRQWPLIKLSLNEINAQVQRIGLKDWNVQENNIKKNIQFKDFRQAFDFMTNIAIIADHTDHHPEWWNVYNQLKITLNTHDAKGVTNKDLFLAKCIDLQYLLSSEQLTTQDLYKSNQENKYLENWNKHC